MALIAGPTASGKSDLAVRLGRALMESGRPAAVINADSAQVYRDLRVLSARPTEEEMAEVPHRLFGAWDGTEACSAPDWALRAKVEIAEMHARGGVPILVGGTGLYLRTLIDGIAPVPPIAPEIRQEIRAMPVSDAHAELAALDPERAAQLAPADTTRIARALEVVRSTGRPLAEWQADRAGGIGDTIALHPAILLPDREAPYRRCDLRFERMIDDGAIGEVEALLGRRLPGLSPVMRAIGVAELTGFLDKRWSLEEAVQRGQAATRQYAKRQYTWFRHQPPSHWRRVETDDYSPEALFEIMLQHYPLT